MSLKATGVTSTHSNQRGYVRDPLNPLNPFLQPIKLRVGPGTAPLRTLLLLSQPNSLINANKRLPVFNADSALGFYDSPLSGSVERERCG